jgi:Family of unknown function (DUF5519)
MLFIVIILMGIILNRIRDELLSWPDVTAEPHGFGGLEFRLHKRELGHIHGDSLADLPFPMDTRNELVNSGRGLPHHVLPKSGWISYWITQGENDIPSVVELFRLRYDQLKSNTYLKKAQELKQQGEN